VRWALRSHQRACAAITEGRFTNEILAVGDFAVDDCPRDTSLPKMAQAGHRD
jgi:acetyl-CoA C-acetyltransferase